MIRVLLADDDPKVRRGLRMRLELEPDLAVIGEAGDGRAAVAQAQELAADVVLMDVRMPGLDGIEAANALRAGALGPAVIMVSLCDDGETKQRSLQAGAASYVCKHEPAEALIAAIRAARPQPNDPDPVDYVG